MPEHGESGGVGSGTDIDTAAEVVGSLLRLAAPQRIHLVCHSMGGAVGLAVAQDLPGLVSFISVEGNLVAADCGLVSRGIAEQSADEFVNDGFRAFVTMLEGSAERSHVEWANWFKKSCPRGLHTLAQSLVEWCDNDKLVGILVSLEEKAYVHGEWSLVHHVTERLGRIAVHSVTNSGHFPMLDNPGEFYELIGAILNGSPTSGLPVVSVLESTSAVTSSI